jgi:hypothetical protein
LSLDRNNARSNYLTTVYIFFEDLHF